jgi:mono/diheme cytochrome c family protein
LAFLGIVLCCALLVPQGFAETTQEIYQAQCASCHGTDGTPTDAGKNLGATDLKSAFVQGLTNQELYNGIALADHHNGYAHAFARRGMTSQQIYELVKYLREMSTEYKRRVPSKRK